LVLKPGVPNKLSHCAEKPACESSAGDFHRRRECRLGQDLLEGFTVAGFASRSPVSRSKASYSPASAKIVIRALARFGTW
jgi:hypothetical protein